MWSLENTGTNERNIYIVVGVVCTLLVALLMAALYLVRIRQKKGGCIPLSSLRVCPWTVLRGRRH